MEQEEIKREPVPLGTQALIFAHWAIFICGLTFVGQQIRNVFISFKAQPAISARLDDSDKIPVLSSKPRKALEFSPEE